MKRELEHYVSTEPFDPEAAESLTEAQLRFYQASQWKLMWWRFKRHRLALISGVFLVLMYGGILISEWIAPYSLHTRHTDHIFAPPQTIRLFHERATG